jgi:hypothetical protein
MRNFQGYIKYSVRKKEQEGITDIALLLEF